MNVITFDYENMIAIRHGHGVKFITPPKNHTYIFTNSMAELKALPMSTYLVAPDSKIIDANKETARVLNMFSIKDMRGRTPKEIFTKESALKHVVVDKTLIQSNKPLLVDESSTRQDGEFVYGISFKLPILNKDNQAIGLLGFSIPFGAHQILSLTNSFDYLAKTGLVKFPQDLLTQSQSPPNLGKFYDSTYITKRENEIIFHIVRGKSVPQTAKLLGISPRTAEQHVENLKNKFGAVSKADLIEMLITKMK